MLVITRGEVATVPVLVTFRMVSMLVPEVRLPQVTEAGNVVSVAGASTVPEVGTVVEASS